MRTGLEPRKALPYSDSDDFDVVPVQGSPDGFDAEVHVSPVAVFLLLFQVFIDLQNPTH